jgi:hypothetical protein
MALRKEELIVEKLFYKLASGIEFNMMDLPKIGKEAEAILLAGGAIEDAEAVMLEDIAKYRLN